MNSEKIWIRDLKILGLWMRMSATQTTPNLHNPLNLEHKSLQDVSQATQSEPIRACYRPVEFALLKKKEGEDMRKLGTQRRLKGRLWRDRKNNRESVREDVSFFPFSTCSPLESGSSKKVLQLLLC